MLISFRYLLKFPWSIPFSSNYTSYEKFITFLSLPQVVEGIYWANDEYEWAYFVVLPWMLYTNMVIMISISSACFMQMILVLEYRNDKTGEHFDQIEKNPGIL